MRPWVLLVFVCLPVRGKGNLRLSTLLAVTILLSQPLFAAPSNRVADSVTNDIAKDNRVELPKGITDSPLLNSRFLLFGSDIARRKALRWTMQRKNTDMVPALIYVLRYQEPEKRDGILKALKRLTGQRIGDDWAKWVRWQQINPQIKPFDGFEVFLTGLFGSMDPGFRDFIYPGVESSIRLEEILWGGVSAKTGIPALTNPSLIEASAATFMSDDELVFGISINGDVRAYPYRFMDWHEMLNDVIDGEPVSLAYCTLCGSGILYKTTVAGRDQPLVFGSSGFLYRSNKLMFDHATDSLWNQFTGKPVVGKLVNSKLQLETLPLVTTSWGEWRKSHPTSKILALETGYVRDYRPGKPYGQYFASAKLMFPVHTDDKRLKQKDQVFGLRMSGVEKAWPLKLFKGGKVINDQVGVLKLVLVGNAKTQTVRAYRSGGQSFQGPTFSNGSTQISTNGESWRVADDGLHGPNGEVLSRLPGHLAYWFAWHNYLGSDTLTTK